jgi:hypothetical protein
LAGIAIMPDLELTAADPLDCKLTISATLVHPDPSDASRRAACRAEMARHHAAITAEARLRSRDVRHLTEGPLFLPEWEELAEVDLLERVRSAERRLALIAEAAAFLFMATIHAPDLVSLNNAHTADAKVLHRDDRRDKSLKRVRAAWRKAGPAGALALALQLQDLRPQAGNRMLALAAVATCIAETIECARNRHRKQPVLVPGYFWRLPATLRDRFPILSVETGSRSTVEAMLRGDHAGLGVIKRTLSKKMM